MDLEELSIEELGELRDRVVAALEERISARQRELKEQAERIGCFISFEPRKLSTGRPKRSGEMT